MKTSKSKLNAQRRLSEARCYAASVERKVDKLYGDAYRKYLRNTQHPKHDIWWRVEDILARACNQLSKINAA